MNLVEIIYKRRSDNGIALKCGKREMCYSELWSEAVRVSDLDTSTNSIDCIIIDNSIEFVVAFFAIFINKKSVLLINPEIKSYELNSIIEKCDIGCIYTISKYKTLINKLKNKNVESIYLDMIETQEMIRVDKKYENVCVNGENENEVAVIIPTSGTTSDKKFTQLTHKNLFLNLSTINDIYGLRAGERELLSLPMTSSFCLTVELLNCLYAGMCIVIYEGPFIPKNFLKLIADEEIDYFITVPAVLKSLCAFSSKPYFRMETVKRITIGGEKATLSELEMFYTSFKDTIIIYGYGMTECSPVITTKTYDDYRYKPLSVGKAIDGVELKIIDDNNESKEANSLGEIVVKGPNIMKGYYGTDYTIIKNDWLYTGDIGYLDEEGYLYISGRKKNMIISAGQNIYPEEVEAVIQSSGLVCEVRVRGVPDNIIGEAIVADVVLNDSRAVDINEIKKYCVNNLPLFKIPKRFFVCNAIEKTATNKIKRVYV